jgi:hypothetical protein
VTRSPTKLVTVLALALSAACGSTHLGGAALQSPEPGRPSSAQPASTMRPPTRTASAPLTSDRDLPAALVGTWVTADTGTITYHLTSSAFESIETISDVRPHGIVEIRVTQEGSAAVDSDRLILTPTAAATSKHDPEHTADSYTDRPGELVPQIYIWHIIGPVLSLKNDAGLEITLKREP